MIICNSFTKTYTLSENYTFKVFEKASELIHTPWSSICKHDPFYQIEYLQEVEASCFPDLIPYYIIAYHNEEPLLALNFQKVIFKGKQLQSFVSQKEKSTYWGMCMTNIVTAITNRVEIPMMVLGNLLQTSHCGIIFKEEFIEENIKLQLVQKGCDVAMNYAHSNTLLITNIYEGSSNCLAKIPSAYNKFYSEPDMHLKIDTNWKKMDDYLQSLQSKYRVRAKKVLADSADITTKQLTLEEIKKYEANIFELNRQVMQHSKFSLGDIHENYFTEMASYFKDAFIMNGYFYQDQLIAFSSLIKDGKTLNSHFIGMDYTFLHSTKIYNRLLFDNLCTAIHNDAETLKYGRTATEIKSTIGAKPLEMVNYLKSNNCCVNYLIKYGLQYMKAPDYTIRHPFK